MKTLLRTAAVGGWVLAWTLMTVATTYGTDVLRGWAILCAVGACVPTGRLIVGDVIEHERERTERLVEAVACRFALEEADRELPRLGGR